MACRHRQQLVGILLACLSFGTSAEVDWPSALQFSFDAGAENPLVLFGFNPQPEPPALTVNQVLGPTRAVQEVSGIEPTPFEFFIATSAGSFSLPTVPESDFSALQVGYTSPGGVDFIFQFNFSPAADADPGSGSNPLFFNPQPEPPADFGEPFGFGFSFGGMRNGDLVSVGLEILNESGEAIPISGSVAAPPVAVPNPAWMLPVMLVLLRLMARRRLRG